MVSYHNQNPLPMYQKSTNFSYAPNPHPWYTTNYHPAAGTQFLAVNGDSSPQQMYYPGVFQPSPDWPGAHEGFTTAGQSTYLQNSINLMSGHHHQNHSAVPIDSASSHGGSLIQSIPTPPMTLVGSDIPTPASSAPTSSTTPPTPAKPSQSKSPFEWMKKTAYQSQPHPARLYNFVASSAAKGFGGEGTTGKTRTKDKYRVVYSDHQRLELEKEFHYTRYITIRRKSELAQSLQLSERQVKIWFQNRRAKDRKQKKKTTDGSGGNAGGSGGGGGSSHQQSMLNSSGNSAGAKYMNVDAKMDPYLQHHLHHSMGLSLHHSNHPALHHPHNHPSPIDSTGHVQTVSSGPISMN